MNRASAMWFWFGLPGGLTRAEGVFGGFSGFSLFFFFSQLEVAEETSSRREGQRLPQRGAS